MATTSSVLSFCLTAFYMSSFISISTLQVMADQPLLLAPSPAPYIVRHHHHHLHHHHNAVAIAEASSPPFPAGSMATLPATPAAVPAFSPREVAIAPAPLESPGSSKAMPAVGGVSELLPPSPGPSINGAPLDPTQMEALRELGIHVPADPCTSPLMHDILLCDKALPERHVIGLHLQLCARDGVLTEETLAHLDTVKALSFIDCPMVLDHVEAYSPDALSLSSLTVIASLGTTADSPHAPPLPGTWLSRFHNLSELAVEEVHVNASGLAFLISKMKHLKQLKFSSTNLTGLLPVHTWPRNVTSIHLEKNSISGPISSTIGRLSLLIELDLSQNELSGRIPNSFTKLKRLQKLVLASNSLIGPIPTTLTSLSSSLIYLDLSHNKLTGSIFEGFNNMKSLRYLDLSHNHFSGPLPFNQTFLNKLNTLKVSGNLGICYDHSSVSSPLLEGIPDCDSSGMPLVPSTLAPSEPPRVALAPFNVNDSIPSHGHRGLRIIFSSVAITLVLIVVFIAIVVLVSKCRNR